MYCFFFFLFFFFLGGGGGGGVHLYIFTKRCFFTFYLVSEALNKSFNLKPQSYCKKFDYSVVNVLLKFDLY